MVMINWIVLTAQDCIDVVSLNGEHARIEPREINNPAANNLGKGTLLGLFVIASRVLNNNVYDRWIDLLDNFPRHDIDSDSLFLPIQD